MRDDAAAKQEAAAAAAAAKHAQREELARHRSAPQLKPALKVHAAAARGAAPYQSSLFYGDEAKENTPRARVPIRQHRRLHAIF